MRRRTIKNAVERAKEEALPQAIREEAGIRARAEVRRALEPPYKPLPALPASTVAATPEPLPVFPQAQDPAIQVTRVRPSETRGNRIFSPTDPRVTGLPD